MLKALLAKGWVKAQNFQRSDRKLGYLYVLTPTGIRHRLQLTQAFLARKEREYVALRSQISALRKDLADQGGARRRERPRSASSCAGDPRRRQRHAAVAAVARALSEAVPRARRGNAQPVPAGRRSPARRWRDAGIAVAAPWSSATRSTASLVLEQLRELGIDAGAVLLEPFGRNTAPALPLAALQALRAAAPTRCWSSRRPTRPSPTPPRSRAALRQRGRARRPPAPSSSSASRPTGPRPATATSAPPAPAARGAARRRALRREARPRDRRALPRRGRLLLEQRHLRAARLGVAGGARALPPRHRRGARARRWAARKRRRRFLRPDTRRVRGGPGRIDRLRGDGAACRRRGFDDPHGAARRRLDRPRRLGRGLAGRREGRRRQRRAGDVLVRDCAQHAGARDQPAGRRGRPRRRRRRRDRRRGAGRATARRSQDVKHIVAPLAGSRPQRAHAAPPGAPALGLVRQHRRRRRASRSSASWSSRARR